MKALRRNLQAVQERIVHAAKRAGRDPSEVTLVAVSKTQSPALIGAAYELGLRDFGENRVEEAEPKISGLPQEISWHMIGHIQSRKAKRVVPIFDMIHSVDSVRLAQRLDRLCADRPEPLPVLVECNVSGEESKYGFRVDQCNGNREARQVVLAAFADLISLSHIQVQGLMTMAPIVSDPEEARPIFVRLRKLRDELAATFPQVDWRHLSMGMTDDFEGAIEEGATLVRVGRAIFAPDVPAWRKP